jgi:hypothetical protein
MEGLSGSISRAEACSAHRQRSRRKTPPASHCSQTLKWRQRTWEATAAETRLRVETTATPNVGKPRGRIPTSNPGRNGEGDELNRYGLYNTRTALRSPGEPHERSPIIWRQMTGTCRPANPSKGKRTRALSTLFSFRLEPGCSTPGARTSHPHSQTKTDRRAVMRTAIWYSPCVTWLSTGL